MNLKVLIIDDDDIILVLHKVRVRKSLLDVNPVCLVDGIEAQEYIKANDNPNTHFLLLLDINMPRMNGWELVNKLESQPWNAQMSIAIVTSSVDKVDRQEANQHRMVFDYFEKPLDDDILEQLKLKFSVSTK